MIRFSIIVPIYNVEDFLEECILSILNQSYDNFEIILVDDGSIDKSSAICNQYNDKYHNVKLLEKKNGGLSSARNEGVKVAKGDYLLFVDGDDFIAKDTLKNLYNIIIENPTVDLICGKFIYYYPDDREKKEDFSFPEVNQYVNGIEYLTSLFEKVPIIIWSACRTIYRREFFIDNRFMFKLGITSEDLELIPTVYMKANKIATYDVPFYYYRQERENSIINSWNSKKFYDLVSIINYHLNNLDESNKRFNTQFVKQLANIYVQYLVLVSYLPRKEREEVVSEMNRVFWIAKYSTGIRGKYVLFFVKILGVRMTSIIYILSKRITSYLILKYRSIRKI
ncbi:glycosyltransferase family 2 protein [Exiguobacterium sp. s189]|uniref:glycosyltransferase family 2 protein n=1 Tax=Exiguobacterium sp. s189 TaxID=2751263 RepID=UPI001BEB47DF|nr:glycosyltransferase family 2 protein [Exiguobacterium sp. s189]